jgi:hypothetical protein
MEGLQKEEASLEKLLRSKDMGEVNVSMAISFKPVKLGAQVSVKLGFVEKRVNVSVSRKLSIEPALPMEKSKYEGGEKK